MTETRSADGCTLCGLPTAGVDVADADGNAYCCVGCRDVYDALGDVDIDPDAVRERRRSQTNGGTDTKVSTPDVPDHHQATFLEVDGMHCATCEAFIEAVATRTEGVSAASASYVTDTVRIDHDPDTISADAVIEAVSGLGYTAYDREDAFSRRQADNMATARVAAGVMVGMAVMLQYIVIIYPTYFAFPFYDDRTLTFLNEAMASASGTYFFIVIGILTTIVLLFTGKPILRGAYVSARTRSPNMDLLVAIAAVSAYLYSTLAVIFVDNPSIYYDVTVAIIVIVTVGSHYETSIKRRAVDRLSDLTAVQVDSARRVAVADVPSEATANTANAANAASDSAVERTPESTVNATGESTVNAAFESEVTRLAAPETVSIDALAPGDHVLVRAGERVPVDGTVTEGEAAVDESVITGESVPIRKESGAQVVGGSIVAEGVLTIAVGPGVTSSLDRVAELVWDLQSGTHGIQKLADTLATIFVPLVLVLAIVVAAVNLALGNGLTTAMLVALTVLIVSCPCALGLATPLAVAAGIRDALRQSIVVFDDTVFERIRGADTVVFDKTGTLTTGRMRVVDRDVDDDLLALAAALEANSAHPVGTAIAATRSDLGESTLADGGTSVAEHLDTTTTGSAVDAAPTIENFESHHLGVSGTVDGTRVVVGHPDLFTEHGWTVPDSIREAVVNARDVGQVPVALGREGTAEGMVIVGDELREGWAETLTALADADIDVVVLTGDDERAATVFRDHDSVSTVFAGVPPAGKAEAVERLTARGRTVMVGDGTNDAPALAAADLGIALGGGTAMAADAADVAIVDDDLAAVETVFELSRSASRRVKGNIGWAFCYNAIAIPLAVTGLLNPLFAALAMGLSSLLVVTNSSRSLLPDE